MGQLFKRIGGLEKLVNIILDSWEELSEAIARGEIKIVNESTMELELACLLKNRKLKIGRQYIVSLGQGTSKTPGGNPEVDILATFVDKDNSYTAAIELKYPHNGTTTDYRFQMLEDIENLEAYIDNGTSQVGFCFAYTTDKSYVNPNSKSSLPVGDGVVISGRYTYNGKEVNINGQYRPEWRTFNDERDCFFTILVS